MLCKCRAILKDSRIVFNIKGNSVRLVAKFHFLETVGFLSGLLGLIVVYVKLMADRFNLKKPWTKTNKIKIRLTKSHLIGLRGIFGFATYRYLGKWWSAYPLDDGGDFMKKKIIRSTAPWFLFESHKNKDWRGLQLKQKDLGNWNWGISRVLWNTQQENGT